MKKMILEDIPKVKCKCGHSIGIYTKLDYIICSYCGSTVYLNDKAKFKGELGKLMKKRFLVEERNGKNDI